MVGFAVYAFEGIATVMPIMQSCAAPDKFVSILIAAIFTLTAVFIFFGELCYLAWGANLNKPIVTEMLPPTSVVVMIMKLLFCINLLFSYAINVYPAN